jgi:transcriptional regulator with XRE-family HTH domain
MNPQKVGELIKELRKNNNLTQKDLADKYGVTYQAVSKWENGTNLPDISLIKEICNDYHLDINEFLDGNTKKSVTNNKVLLIVAVIMIVALIITLGITLYLHFEHIHDHVSIEMKPLSTTCESFKITGDIAYNKEASAIRIKSISYCGEEDKTKYDSITCTLTENDNVIYTCDNMNNITLKEYLDNISIKVDNYKNTCSIYKNNTLILSIDAKNGDKNISYTIPLQLEDEC